MKDARIEAIWDEIEDAEPDISTERLMATVCERASLESGREIDAGDVSAALYRIQQKKLARREP